MADFTKPVIFKLGNEEYGVDISVVNGIEREQRIIPIPNSQSYILGLINLRGAVVPVYSLKRKFHIPQQIDSAQNMIIVKIKDTLLALDVDSVSDIHDFTPDSIIRMPGIVQTPQTQYFDRIAHQGKRIILLIDIEKLLSDEELEEARKLADEMKK